MERPNEIERLQQVHRVEAPPFLFTRIQARIEAQIADTVPVQWAWLSFATVVVLIVANSFAITGTVREKGNSIQSFTEGMGIRSSNQLYHE